MTSATTRAAPTIVWLRRDLRLDDNRALAAAAAAGPTLPVFILDPVIDAQLGAAQRLRLGASLAALGRDLAASGAPLVLRRGAALPTLLALAAETGARSVRWTRLTDAPSLARDREAKAGLKAAGLAAHSHEGFTLLDPAAVKTGAGEPYRVFTPFWRAFAAREVPAPVPAPRLSGVPGVASDRLEDWGLSGPMGPAAGALAASFRAGEAAARARLDAWLDGPAPRYGADRNRLDRPEAGTGLSDALALGEISPRRVWAEMDRAGGAAGVEAARRQLVWRDFAHVLLFHDGAMERESWRRDWARFPWRDDNDEAERWRRGETGVAVIDAAMRELWATGRMHNRARMLVGSWLTKHLLTHWRIGAEWFRETLIDWDPANNAMGWQWVAGSGPDAAPFFRIFNPETQGETFDPDGRYRRHWLAGAGAETFAAMRPKSWGPAARPGRPQVDLAAGRARALEAWAGMRDKTAAETA